jgi:hypothetical protein
MVSLSTHDSVRTRGGAVLYGSSLDKLGMKRVTMWRSSGVGIRR